MKVGSVLEDGYHEPFCWCPFLDVFRALCGGCYENIVFPHFVIRPLCARLRSQKWRKHKYKSCWFLASWDGQEVCLARYDVTMTSYRLAVSPAVTKQCPLTRIILTGLVIKVPWTITEKVTGPMGSRVDMIWGDPPFGWSWLFNKTIWSSSDLSVLICQVKYIWYWVGLYQRRDRGRS